MKLTSEQQAVADIREGQHLVAAGPGSGQTATLVQRVVALLLTGVTAARILVATFTKGASLEFSERIQAAHDLGQQVEVRTWHSWGFRVLREAGLAKGVLGGRDKGDPGRPKKVLTGIWIDWKLQETQPNGTDGFTADLMADRIARAKISGHTPENPPANWPPEWVRVWTEYDRRTWQAGWVDYADMLLRPVLLFRQDPTLLEQWRKRYNHVMVDECQDNNGLQWELAAMLAGGAQSLVSVGDLRQAIYRFAGATPERMVAMSKQATVHSITLNWRSTTEVVDACNRLMDHADQAIGSPFQAPEDKHGPEVQVCEHDGGRSQGAAVALAVKAQLAAGIEPKEISVIYRANRCSAYPSMALLREGIPHVIRGKNSFYALRHIRVLLDYLRVANGLHRGDKAIRSTYNMPKRYLGARSMGLNYNSTWTMEDLHDVGGRARRRVEAYLDDLAVIANAPDPESALRQVLDLTSYGRDKHTLAQELAGVVGEQGGDDGGLEEDWEMLCQMASEYKTTSGFLAEVDRMSAVSIVNPDTDEEPNAVVLQTAHRAKGTEYDAVHIVDCTEGTMPHAMALIDDAENETTDGLEEERRVMFVAMSRARAQLVVHHTAYDYKGREAAPSRFIAEARLTDSIEGGE
jgi:DNA helicase-2/ATP-dependent DNA helicase PcrA